MAANVLIVDDEKLIRWSIGERLKREGMTCVEAIDGAQARLAVETQPFDVILLDIKLPDISGMDLLHIVREAAPQAAVIMITAYSSIANAVEAMKAGAYDYITKPFDMDELALLVRQAAEAAMLRDQVALEASKNRSEFAFATMIAESEPMKRVVELATRIAETDATTVLILGESGCGKDLLARAIHYASGRASKPFVHITCSALPDGLLESELFGHVRGAFTGARGRKRGLLEVADGGTAFLNEIGEMPLSLQSKLLRALEDKVFKPVGGTSEITVDTRLIAATNSSLEAAVEEKTFREDLYYRLNILPIYLPPLRERRADIVPLARLFLARFARELARPDINLTKTAEELLVEYPWPGNVRELRNAIERAVLLAAGPAIHPKDIVLGRDAAALRFTASMPLITLPPNGVNLEQVERELVKQALARTHWNRTRAAQLLQISRDQIRYKIEKFELDTNNRGI